MDAQSTGSAPEYSSSDFPPILVISESDDGGRRAASSVESAGLRLAGCVGMDAALDRIDQQGRALAVWLELAGAEDEQLEAVLDRMTADVGNGRYSGIVSTPLASLDSIFARTMDSDIDLLVGADEPERLSTLRALAPSRAHRLNDAATDRSAARLRQLSEEVSRIASTLARLSTGPQPLKAVEPPAESAELPDLSAEAVGAVIRARRARSKYFPEELFADPAWDMLLDLLQSEIRQFRVPVSSLCIAAAVPATTALRWLKTMTEQGLFVRRADPHDGRRVFVELAPATSHALRRYFAEVGRQAVI